MWRITHGSQFFFFFKVAFIVFLQMNSLYVYSLQDKITEFYMPWNLNCLSLPGWSTIVFFYILWSIFSAYLNPFQQWLYNFEIHLFILRTVEGLIYTAIVKGENIYWCSRSKHNALGAGGENFWMFEDCLHFSFKKYCGKPVLLNIICRGILSPLFSGPFTLGYIHY